ncbi:DUF1822 family protein [Limnofasciculus baicalensis]|uniref:DUF1822 family protein n=1 Tax=Limnofasciculus baicalensis BBK-W-15 TaxID=2699891 RepID=A0AAE3GXQ1_9CYAN|nr:DUF1822 family protein [Limnofasciculus baicalensis]MCP2731763.1 DUF1822 family protein [Limnofasciculus baicalensis BBK-W-15]
MNNTEISLLTIPLGREAHDFARRFAAQQATVQKGKRVYLNTLAVYAVHSYMNWLEIETNLNQSDSWHPGNQAVFDIADLVLPGIGKLECRPVLPGETVFYLPPEVTENRIGYIGIQFSESLSEVQLLGFVPPIDAINPPEELKIADFQPLDTLIDQINYLKEVPKEKTIIKENSLEIKFTYPLNLVNLSGWFENIFQRGWQSMESLLHTANLAWSFRGTIQLGEKRFDDSEVILRGAKLIDLGIQLAGYPVALVVTIIPETNQKTHIIIQVHPTVSVTYLPPSIRLTVFDESGVKFLEAEARNADNFIQLQFSGNVGEHFTVEVGLGVASIREDFVI